MARRRNRNLSVSNGRGVKITSNHRLPHLSELLSPIPARQQIYRPQTLASLPDNRRYYPRRFRSMRPSLTIRGERAAIKNRITRNLHVQSSFDLPREVVTCVRRSQRKEVLFATRRAGRGKRNYNRHVRRTRDSKVRC